MKPKPKRVTKRVTAKRYWAGYVDGKLDDREWEFSREGDVTFLMSVFPTRALARELYRDVRPVYIVPAKIRKAK